MRIKRIKSSRNYEQLSYWHLVYEWEDDFSNYLKIPIVQYTTIEKAYQKIMHYSIGIFHLFGGYDFLVKVNNVSYAILLKLGIVKLYSWTTKKILGSDKMLVFEMYPNSLYNISPKCNKIIYIIDFDYGVDLERFFKMYKNCELILISGLQAYNYLKEKNCPLNIRHIPLSLSNKYNPICTNENRMYDIIIAGRKNRLLWEYIQRYEKHNPQIHYIYSHVEKAKFYFKSNQLGIIGQFSDRASYINLLKQCKISFYSTPGIDEPQTKFVNHVTSRLFENIYAGCFIIARYPDNEEVSYFNLDHVCENVTSYEHFETLISNYLVRNNKDLYAKYSSYIEKHYTSASAKILKEIIHS